MKNSPLLRPEIAAWLYANDLSILLEVDQELVYTVVALQNTVPLVAVASSDLQAALQRLGCLTWDLLEEEAN